MNINLQDLTIPQLKEIRSIIMNGPVATSETCKDCGHDIEAQLCHKSPPKGYPEEKSQYGDPECYRYPLNTKARCKAAWSYVHHADNKRILGKKFKSVESKIRSYAKKHYGLELETGGESEGEEFDWAQAFVDYYDNETMGERCEEVELENENEVSEMGDKETTADPVVEKVESADPVQSEQDKSNAQEQASQDDTQDKTQANVSDEFMNEIVNLRKENEELRAFKEQKELAELREALLKSRKEKMEAVGLAMDESEEEVNRWLGMSEDDFNFTIKKMSGMKASTATAEQSVKVPAVTGDGAETLDNKEIIKRGLAEHKKNRESK
jgi:hypothetical protein